MGNSTQIAAQTNDTEVDDHEGKQVAEAAARYAHNGYFSSRMGILPSDGHMLVYYNNNPYRDKERRERIHAALKSVLTEKYGAELIGEATYGGDHGVYTAAIVWEDCNGELAEVFEEELYAIIKREFTN